MVKNILCLVAVLGSYLLGSLNFSYILGRCGKGLDLRRVGSGNLGTANVYHEVGRSWGAVAFFADCAQEAAVVLIMRSSHLGLGWQAAGGLAVIAGHNWSAFLSFQGGRGMAMTLTGTLILLPWEGLLMVALLALGVVARRTAELNLLALCLVPVLAWRLGRPVELVAFALMVLLLTLLRRLQGSPWLGKTTLREDPRRVIWNRIIYDRETERADG